MGRYVTPQSDFKGNKVAGVRGGVYSPVDHSLKLVKVKGEVIERRDCCNEYYGLRIEQLVRIVRNRYGPLFQRSSAYQRDESEHS